MATVGVLGRMARNLPSRVVAGDDVRDGRLVEAVRHRLLAQVRVERDEREGLLEAGLRRDEPLVARVGEDGDAVAGPQAQRAQPAAEVVGRGVDVDVAEPAVVAQVELLVDLPVGLHLILLGEDVAGAEEGPRAVARHRPLPGLLHGVALGADEVVVEVVVLLLGRLEDDLLVGRADHFGARGLHGLARLPRPLDGLVDGPGEHVPQQHDDPDEGQRDAGLDVGHDGATDGTRRVLRNGMQRAD